MLTPVNIGICRNEFTVFLALFDEITRNYSRRPLKVSLNKEYAEFLALLKIKNNFEELR